MTIKQFKFLSIFLIFGLSFITHNLYEINNNIIFKALFPINENIFQHLKMIFSTYMIVSCLEYLIMNKRYKYNLLFSNVVSSISCILIFLIMFMPLYIIFSHNIIITLSLYFISIIISSYISFKIANITTYNNNLRKISYFIIIISYIIFIFFTYFPLNNIFFH